MKKVDLNVDIGEGFPFDRELLTFATSANICCGEHAGSWDLTKETIQLCLEAGTRIGMHPGYPDRENIGRKSMEASQTLAYCQSVRAQVDRFFFFVPAAYLKPHGALYNDAVGESEPAESARKWVGIACRRFLLPLMALPGSRLASVASDGLIKEGFADRAYRDDGTLVPRTESGAVLQHPEEVRRQVLELAPKVDSFCLHGDTTGCLNFAELVFKTLVDSGFEVGY